MVSNSLGPLSIWPLLIVLDWDSPLHDICLPYQSFPKRRTHKLTYPLRTEFKSPRISLLSYSISQRRSQGQLSFKETPSLNVRNIMCIQERKNGWWLYLKASTVINQYHADFSTTLSLFSILWRH